MSVVTTFPFTTPGNYTGVNAEISGGAGILSFVDLAAQSFSQTFDSDAGFTYDSAKTAFVGGLMRQVDTRPANATFHAAFSTSKDGNWGDGATLTGTLVNGAAIAGGFLDLRGGAATDKYWEIDDNSDNAELIQQGTIRVIFKPNYSGNPSDTQWIFYANTGASTDNALELDHTTSGDITLRFRDSSGGIIQGFTSLGNFNPTAGQEYEFELNFDIPTTGEGGNGEIRVFVDGVQLGSTITPPAGDRTACDNFRIGTNNTVAGQNADFEAKDLIIFDTVQHTSDYTPGATIPATIYQTDEVSIPDFSYSGLGTVQSIQSISATEVGSITYTIEGMYWNGSTWTASDGTRAQSNTLSIINANIAALDVSGQSAISMQVFWDATNTQNSIDNLQITYTGQQYATEGSLLTNNTFVAREITDFQAEESKPANTAITYIININAVDFYYNGSSWVESNGTSAQSNDLATLQANLDSLLGSNSTMKIKVVLTGDQTVTPEIDSITVTYDFGALEPAAPEQSQVYMFFKTPENLPIQGVQVDIEPNRDISEYVEAADRIIGRVATRTSDANGFVSFNLIKSKEFEPSDFQYKLTYRLPNEIKTEALGSSEIIFTVDDVPEQNITDQIIAA